jgi:hypothetical protein
MNGCAAEAISPVGFSIRTDQGKYRAGDEMEVTASLSTNSETTWGSAFPLVGGVVDDCILEVLVTKAEIESDRIVEVTVFQRLALGDPLQLTCSTILGGFGRFPSIVITPPTYEQQAAISLISNVGDTAGRPLPPGLYAVEATLKLQRIAEDAARPEFSPLVPEPRARAVIEIVE